MFSVFFFESSLFSILQSLAKFKRMALYSNQRGFGIIG